jgi:hypothetical protein
MTFTSLPISFCVKWLAPITSTFIVAYFSSIQYCCNASLIFLWHVSEVHYQRVASPWLKRSGINHPTNVQPTPYTLRRTSPSRNRLAVAHGQCKGAVNQAIVLVFAHNIYHLFRLQATPSDAFASYYIKVYASDSCSHQSCPLLAANSIHSQTNKTSCMFGVCLRPCWRHKK